MRYLITFCCLLGFMVMGTSLQAQTSHCASKKTACTKAEKAKCAAKSSASAVSWENPTEQKTTEEATAVADRASDAAPAKAMCTPAQKAACAKAGKTCDPAKCTPEERAKCAAKMAKTDANAEVKEVEAPKAKAIKVKG